MKIKTTVNVQKEIDIEVKIPYFCRSENELVFYKVLNEVGYYMSVSIYAFATSIEFRGVLNEELIFDPSNTEIEENEFNEAFENALGILKNK